MSVVVYTHEENIKIESSGIYCILYILVTTFMINKPLIKLINNAHYIAYFICVIIGLRVFVQQTFQNEIWLGGDEWEYQSIAVNFHYGYGFQFLVQC